MIEELSKENLLNLLERICSDMESSQDQLQELDAKMGDGDLGVTVKLGFSAVRNNLSKIENEDIALILIKSGMVFNNAAASTFGTLMATAFMCAGTALKGRTTIDLDAMSQMLLSAIKGIVERGGAVVGDCTMLDALVPAQKAFQQSIERKMPLYQSVAMAAEAADIGAKSTKDMMAKHGRAGWLSEKSRGIPDAGAVAVALLFKSFSRGVLELTNGLQI